MTAINDAPVITSLPVTTVTNQAYSYQIIAEDVDGDSLTYTATTKPTWLEINANLDGSATLSGSHKGTPESGSRLDDATDLGLGWKYSEWFGVFYEAASGWVYHTGLGWLHIVDQNSSSLWFWTEKLGWVWTDATDYHSVTLDISDGTANATQTFTIATGTFPNLYSQDAASWLHYETTTSPTQFYNHSTGKWIGSVYSYTVNATINDSVGGTITGGGIFELGESATLTASPVTGYKFTGWSGDVTSTEKSIQFTVSSELTIQANFSKFDVDDWSDKFN